jgi:thioesterase domain-containing protein/acyl carrier protein
MGRSIVSHVSLMRDSSADLASFDVTVTDPKGRVLVEIQDFTMRRLDPASLTAPKDATAQETTIAAQWIAEGIEAHDGTRILDRVLSARPGPEVVVSSIPLVSLRRDVDALRDHRGAAPAMRGHAGADAPSGDVERELAHLWQDLLGVEDVGANDDFFELGGHSLIAVRLVNRIEKRFGTKIRLATLFEARTVRQLAALLGGSATTSAYSSLVAIQPNGTLPALFVAHAVGGEVLSYSELSRLLGSDQPFFGFRAVGHDGHQPLLTSIEEQAAFYIKEMRMQQPQGPYYLAGYSHGGRVVYEMALQLAAAGERTAFLGILDTWPTEGLPRGWSYVGHWLNNVPKWMAADFAESGWEGNLDRVKRVLVGLKRRVRAVLPGGKVGERSIAEDMDLGGLPEHIRLTYETNFRAFLRYKPRHYDGPLTLFRAYAQPLNGPHGADLGWSLFASDVRVIGVPGNHGGLLLQPDVRDLARAIRSALGDVRAGSQPR